MSISITRVESPSKNKEMGRGRKSKKGGKRSAKNGGTVSESYYLGEVTTLPLIFLEGEIQQRELHKPGMSMGAINILEENDPAVIKKYLSGFIDLPTNLLNVGSNRNKEESICIDLEGLIPPEDVSIGAGKPTWFVREVAVSPPRMVYGCKSKEKAIKSIKDDSEVIEATTASEVIERTYSFNEGMIDEFSMELEKKLKEIGYGDGVLLEGDEDVKAVFRSSKEEQEGSREDVGRTHVTDSDDTYVVEDVLLIYNNGTLIFHARRESDVDIDDDIFSGMLTAVKDFVKDSFRRRDDGGLKRMDFGMNKVLIEYGRNVYLTTVLLGGEPAYLPLYMMEVLKDVEEKYSSVLDDWDGRLERLGGINKIVTKLLSVTDRPTVDIDGFDSGAVASTIKLIEKAKENGMPASNPKIFAKNITKAIEKEGFGNAWNYLKRTEQELVEFFNKRGTKGAVQEMAESEDQAAIPLVSEEPEATDFEGDAETAELENTVKGIVELMDELDAEKRGTEEERTKLREMVKDIGDRMVGYGGGAEGTEEDRSALKDIVTVVMEKMNELKMESMDSDVEKAEMEGTIKGIEDKMTEFEISQIGAEAESTELKRMMDGIEDKIAEIESGNIETEVAKAELEGMIEGIEDKMEEFEISQIGTEAERTELKRMMDRIEDKIAEIKSENIEAEVAKAELEGMIEGIEDKMEEFEISQIGTEAERTELKLMMEGLQQKISELNGEAKETEEVKAKMEDTIKEMEARMAELEAKIQGTEDKMEELEGEIEVRRFTIEYIQNLEDEAELEALCKEAGLSTSGSKTELKNRLLRYVEGKEQDAEGQSEAEDQRFTRGYIENVATKAELVELCEEAGLKKSGRKEELRDRLLEFVKEREVAKKGDKIGAKHQFKLEGADKLVYAVLGDMLKHLSMDVNETVKEYVEELEGFIKSVLEIREELGLEPNELIKSVVIKPYNDKTGEVLNKLKTPFLTKVKAENLEVVEPGKEWEGIKLQMEINKDMVSAAFKSQATKIQMLLKLQSPHKIKQILEEKGEYTLGVEGYPVTIAPGMLNFNVITPENFVIKEMESGIVYVDKETIKDVETEQEAEPEPEPEPEPEGEVITPGPPEPPKPTQPEERKRFDGSREIPPPPPDYPQKEKSSKKKGRFIGKLKRRLKR